MCYKDMRNTLKHQEDVVLTMVLRVQVTMRRYKDMSVTNLVLKKSVEKSVEKIPIILVPQNMGTNKENN